MKYFKKLLFLVFLMIFLFSIADTTSFAKSKPIIKIEDNGKYKTNKINGFDLKTKFNLLVENKISTLNNIPYETNYYIVQFNTQLDKKLKKDLEKREIIFYKYIPDNSYIIKLDQTQVPYLESLNQVNWVGKFYPEYKTTNLDLNEDKILLIITIFDSKDLNLLKNKIEELGANVYYFKKDILKISIETNKINDLTKIEGIYNIGPYEVPNILNDVARDITNINYVWDNLGYFGEGQIISIADSGLDTGVNDNSMHDDLEGRIVSITNFYDPYITADGASDLDSGHGTHVAGSALGDGNLSGSNPQINNFSLSFAGVAPKSQLYFQAAEQLCDDLGYCGVYYNTYSLFGMPVDLYDLFKPAYDQGSRIHSNSWGNTDCAGFYDSWSVSVDEFVWNYSDMNILFAAGNSGSGIETIACPGGSKNIISVGALENASHIATYSSRGYTDDGRIKPDLLAPGSWIISARSSLATETGWGVYNSNYMYMGGTSMATPHVAGIVALIREHLNKTDSYSNPSAALIKALLINGAQDIDPLLNPRPNNHQGFGKIDLKNSLLPDYPKKIFYFDNKTGLDSLDYFSTNFSIELNSSIPLRVSLVWSDYPGTQGSGTQLVNDLDLTLINPSNITFNGNDNIMPRNDSIDTKNNVEEIDIALAEVGTYIVNVSASNVPYGPQPFALVISYGVYDQQITINTPQENEILNTNNVTLNVSIPVPGIVKYSLDNGPNITMDTTDDLIHTYNLNLSDNNYSIIFHSFNLADELADTESISSFATNSSNPYIVILSSPLDKRYALDNVFLNVTLNERANLSYSVNGGNQIKLNSSDSINYYHDITTWSAGNNTINFYLTDLLGSINNSFNTSFEVDDSIPEIVAWYMPVADTIYTKNNMTVDVTLSDPGSIKLSLDGGTNFTMNTSNNLSFVYNLSNLYDGYHNLTFYSSNDVGYINSETITFGIDNISLDVISYTNTSYINSSILSIPFNATFNNNITSIYYTINDLTQIDISDEINLNKVDTLVDVIGYHTNDLRFYYFDIFNNSNNIYYQVHVNTSWDVDSDDKDMDSIKNWNDTLTGNISNINTNINNLSIYVNDSTNISKPYNDIYLVEFKDDSETIIEFNNDFANNEIDVSNITIKKEAKENNSKMFIRGLSLGNEKKSIYFDLKGDTSKFGSICIKDKIIYGLSQLDSNCNSSNEIYVNTLPYNSGGYSVTALNSTRLKISGLNHTGIVQVCTEDWTYGTWATCSGGTRSRTASDNNNCGTTFSLGQLVDNTCTDPDPDTGGSSGSTSDPDPDPEEDPVDDEIIEEEEEEEITYTQIIEPTLIIKNKYDLTIDGNDDLEKNFTGERKVLFKDKSNGVSMLYFNYDFEDEDLDLSDLEVYSGSDAGAGYTLILGLDLNGEKKTAKVPIVKNSSKVCVKDMETESISQISSNCDGAYEHILNCNGLKNSDGYTCFTTGNYYTISGLKHSAIMEYGEKVEVKEIVEEVQEIPQDVTSQEDIIASTTEIVEEDEGSFLTSIWSYVWVGVGLLAIFIIW